MEVSCLVLAEWTSKLSVHVVFLIKSLVCHHFSYHFAEFVLDEKKPVKSSKLFPEVEEVKFLVDSVVAIIES